MFKIKIRPADRLFTKLVRRIHDHTCQKCGRVYIPEVHDLKNLGTSHYFGRNRESTRFDLENVTLLCNFPCHRQWEGEKRGDYKDYMIKRLGQEGFDLLEYRANQYQKRDDALMILWLKEELSK